MLLCEYWHTKYSDSINITHATYYQIIDDAITNIVTDFVLRETPQYTFSNRGTWYGTDNLYEHFERTHA